MKKYSLYFALLLAALLLNACSTLSPPPLSKQAMTPEGPGLVFHSTGKTIEMGTFEGPHGKGQNIYLINIYDLKSIVVDGLTKSKLFDSVDVESQPGVDYQLTAKIKDQTTSGLFTITGVFIVDYEIKRQSTGEVVFSQRITGSHPTTTGEAFQGVNRVRMAIEGSAKDNVKQLLEAISKLKL